MKREERRRVQEDTFSGGIERIQVAHNAECLAIQLGEDTERLMTKRKV